MSTAKEIQYRVRPIRYYGGSGFVIEVRIDATEPWMVMGGRSMIYVYETEEDARAKIVKAIDITGHFGSPSATSGEKEKV